MPKRYSTRLTYASRGFTLVELLVVVTIMLILVAAAIPILRPLNSDRKSREAARQVQTFISEAKALAARRGRTVGVLLDCSFNASNSADSYDPDAVTKLYLAEQPPAIETPSVVLFTPNDSDITRIQRLELPNPAPTPTNVPARWCVDANAILPIVDNTPPPPLSPADVKSITSMSVYAYAFFGRFGYVSSSTGPMLEAQPDAYVQALIYQAPINVPFTLQISGYSQHFTCVRELPDRVLYVRPGETLTIPRVRVHSKHLPTWDGVNVSSVFQAGAVADVDRVAASTPKLGIPNGPYGASSGGPTVTMADYAAGSNNGVTTVLSGRIYSPPTRSGTNVLELPTGVAIDLRCSGLGPQGYGAAPLRDNSNNVAVSPTIMFRPDGSIDSINGYQQAQAVHLLIGSTKRMQETSTPAVIKNPLDTGAVMGLNPNLPPIRNPALLADDSAYGNLRDGSSLWVTIANRTGNVTVADNAPVLRKPDDAPPLPARHRYDMGGSDPADRLRRGERIQEARDLARNGKTKGGL